MANDKLLKVNRLPVSFRYSATAGSFIFCVIGPLVCGSMIYVFLRTNKPRVFDVLLGYLPIFEQVKLTSFFDKNISNLILYNLPDGLWSFSLASFICIFTEGNSKHIRYLYISISLMLVLAQEVLQGVILPGTYDPIDLVFNMIGFLLASILFTYKRHP